MENGGGRGLLKEPANSFRSSCAEVVRDASFRPTGCHRANPTRIDSYRENLLSRISFLSITHLEMRYSKGIVCLLALGLSVTREARPQGIAGLKFTVGVKGGFPLTDPYDDVQRLGMYQQTPVEDLFWITPTIETGSKSKDYVVGPTLKLFLPFHLSVEADGLYRPISLRESISYQNLPLGPPLDIVPDGPIFSTYPSDSALSHQDSSWEVSLLPSFMSPCRHLCSALHRSRSELSRHFRTDLVEQRIHSRSRCGPPYLEASCRP